MKKTLSVFLGACVCAAFVQAKTTTWNGGASGSWDVAGNWSDGVPEAGDTAQFNATASITGTMTLPASGTVYLSVLGGKTLDLNGAISGAAKLQVGVNGSDTTNYGTVNFNADNSSFTGDLSIQAGRVHCKHDNGFGSASSGKVSSTGRNTYSLVYYENCTSLRSHSHNCNNASSIFFTGTVTVGKLNWDGVNRWSVDGTLNITGDNSGAGFAHVWIVAMTKGSSVNFTGNNVSMNPYEGNCTDGIYTFSGTNFNVNSWGYSSGILSKAMKVLPGGKFKSNSRICIQQGGSYPAVLDLNSTTQTVQRLYSLGNYTNEAAVVDAASIGHVKSDKGGLFIVNPDANFKNSMSFDGEVSVDWHVDNAVTEAVLYGASTTKGEMVVSSGTIQLHSGFAWRYGAVRLNGGTLELASGTFEVGKLVDANGITYGPGRYSADGAGGTTAVAGLTGSGVIEVVAKPVPLATTWIGGGAAGDWNDEENWSEGVPGAGTAVSITNDVTITSGIVHASGNMKILVATGATLDLEGEVSGAGNLQFGNTESDTVNCGVINFKHDNSNFTGAFTVLAGDVHCRADNGLGAPTASAISVTARSVYVNAVWQRRCAINYHDCTSLRPLYYIPSDQRECCNFHGTVTLGGFSFGGGVCRLMLYGTLYVTGTAGGGAGGAQVHAISFVGANSELHLENPNFRYMPYGESAGAGLIVLNATGCKINTTSGWYNGSTLAMMMRCDVDNAFNTTSTLRIQGGSAAYPACLDLNSTTQTITRLWNTGDYLDRTKKVDGDVSLGRVKGGAGSRLTVIDTANYTNRVVFTEQASLEYRLGGSATYTLMGKSTSSGELLVTSGTVVLAHGFAWEGTLKLNGGTVNVPDGTFSVGKIVDANGAEYGPGLYAANSLPGFTGSGSLNVLPPADPVEEVWIWQGGGGNDSIQTLANWQGAATLPNFTSAGNVFKFPANASVTVDRPMNAKKLVFDQGASGTARLAASGNGAISLYNGGVYVQGNASAPKTVELDVPVNFHNETTFSLEVTEKDVLKFTGKITALKTANIYKWGYGDLWFVNDDNDFSGNMVFSNGFFYVSGAAPLKGIGNLYRREYDSAKYAKTVFCLSNAVVTCDYFGGAKGSTWRGTIAAASCSTNRFDGNYTIDGNWPTPEAFGNGCVFEVTSGRFGASGMTAWSVGYDPATGSTDVNSTSFFKLTGKPLSLMPAYWYAGNDSSAGWKYLVEFACSSNIVHTGDSKLPAQAPFSNYGALFYGYRLAAPDAIHPWVQLILNGPRSRIDLGGYEQHLHNLAVQDCNAKFGGIPAGDEATLAAGGSTGCIHGGPGSKLTLTGTPVCDAEHWDGVSEDRLPNFGQAASIERAGAGTSVFRCANTSTGEVFVTGGRLVFARQGDPWTYWKTVSSVQTPEARTTAVNATWAGNRVTVTGGVLDLHHSKVFPEDVEVYVDGGTINLPAGVRLKAKAFCVREGGEWKRFERGMFGAADNASVSAENRYACITGGGTIVTKVGMALIFR